jgi:multiple sugar transport system substrate-binding protein
VTGTGIGVSAFTNKKGPAYFYCQWATNKLNQLRILETGAGAPCRDSAYRDPRGMANLKVPKEWAEALVECGKIGRPMLPVIIPVTEFRDVFGIALTNMIGGADPAAELKKATEQFRPILEKSEKG